jgi:hypothetical protein
VRRQKEHALIVQFRSRQRKLPHAGGRGAAVDKAHGCFAPGSFLARGRNDRPTRAFYWDDLGNFSWDTSTFPCIFGEAKAITSFPFLWHVALPQSHLDATAVVIPIKATMLANHCAEAVTSLNS